MADFDLYCEWGGDLVITPNGSVQFASGWPRIREKIVRIIITNSALTLPDGSTTAPDYVFDPTFGQSAGALVDQNPTQKYMAGAKQRITAAIQSSGLSDTLPAVAFSQPTLGAFVVSVSVVVNGVSYSTSVSMRTTGAQQ